MLPTRVLAVLAALLGLSLGGPGPRAATAEVRTAEVRAELVAHAPQGVEPGQTLWLGLRIEHAPKWHTYWKNPGDSGLPTTLAWTLPAGFSAGEIEWPTPARQPIGPLMNYGYEGTLLLPVPVKVPAGFREATLEVKLRADWLVCKDVCIPQGGDFALSLPARAATASHAALFAAAREAAPRDVQTRTATARLEGGRLVFEFDGLPAALQGRELALLPETAGVIANAEPQQVQWQGSQLTMRVAVDPQRSESPRTLPAVLIGGPDPAGVRVQVEVTTPWPAVTPVTAPAAAPLPAAAPAAPDGPAMGWALALVLALAGGALLNLMPCVFPVLSLKVLGYAAHAHDRRQLMAGGVAYTAGVVLSFVALAGVLLALRAGGEQLGWGFQLQNPGVVAALAALFTLIGLNLAGAFEFGSVLPAGWAGARARHPLADQALTGVLAVAVASPCTAPFMGASLGLAVTLPAAQALAIFAALGLGMALPYLALTAWPALTRALPRPGPWMAHFKTVMAFPMFATVVWLVWVLGQQVGIDGAAGLLALLVALAFLAWALGSPALGRRGRLGFGALAGLTMAAALLWALPGLSTPPAQAASAANADEDWQPWSAQRVAELTAQGKPVFVDFTAAWCVTCQFNKRTVLRDGAVLADFRRRGVTLMRADWTRRDAAITAELTRLGRSGVPVYALYAPGATSPRLLSELPRPGEIFDALASLR